MTERAVTASLGPAHDGKEANPLADEPGALLTCGKSHIGFSPAFRPMIFVAVESRRAHPVLKSELMGIANAQAPLLGQVDEKEAAERPESLSAEALLALLVEDDDALAGIRDLRGGDEAGEPGADHDHVCVERHGRCGLRFERGASSER